MPPIRRLPGVALSILGGVVALGMVSCGGHDATGERPPPNIVVILSDDQPIRTMDAMPYLRSRHWTAFRNAYINTPLCCPSRVAILTGLYSNHNGVEDNREARLFSPDKTLPTWLKPAGYHTALIGKYLNRYPWNRGPFIPPGWDHWEAFLGDPRHFDYRLYVDGRTKRYGHRPRDYATDVLTQDASRFIATSHTPLFLYFAPPVPHKPYDPAPRYRGTVAPGDLQPPPSFNEHDVSDKPPWISSTPPLSRNARRALRRQTALVHEMIRSADDAVKKVVAALRKRGILHNTVIFYLSDNGVSLGVHRFRGKPCPYEECTATPLFVRYPQGQPLTIDRPVSNVDLAPTIATLAHASRWRSPVDGHTLEPLLNGQEGVRRRGVLLHAIKSKQVPEWWAIHTKRYEYVAYHSGDKELYDLKRDPYQLRNLAGEPREAALERRLAGGLRALRQRQPHPGG